MSGLKQLSQSVFKYGPKGPESYNLQHKQYSNLAPAYANLNIKMTLKVQRKRLPNFKALALPRTKPSDFEIDKVNNRKNEQQQKSKWKKKRQKKTMLQ